MYSTRSTTVDRDRSPETAQRRRAVASVRRTVGLPVVPFGLDPGKLAYRLVFLPTDRALLEVLSEERTPRVLGVSFDLEVDILRQEVEALAA
jgi:hypothetical protein